MSTVPRNTGVIPNALMTKKDLSAHESANLHDYKQIKHTLPYKLLHMSDPLNRFHLSRCGNPFHIQNTKQCTLYSDYGPDRFPQSVTERSPYTQSQEYMDTN